MNLEELLARLESISELSDEELAEVESQLRDTYRALRAGDLSPDVIALLTSIAESVDKITAEQGTRREAADLLEREAAELDGRLVETNEGETEETTEDDTKTPDESDGSEESESTEDAGAAGETTEAETTEEQVPVTAAATRPSPRPISELARRTPVGTRPVARQSGARIFATPNVPQMRGGQDFTDRAELARAMLDTWNANRGASGDGVKVPVARIEASYPDDRRLLAGDSAWTVFEKVQDALAPFRTQEAITAAGGICAPTTPLYDQPVISHASRPVRDALPGFNADRGGINWITPPSLASIGTTGGTPGQAIDQITEAEDAADAIKPHQFVDCGSPQSTQIYAVTNILEFGNLMQRTFPEEVAAYTDLSMAAHARYAENLLLQALYDGSTHVTTQQDLGVARDVINFVNLAAVGYRSRHRMPIDAPIRVLLPAWIIAMIQNDAWSGLESGLNSEGITVTEATVTSWLAQRNVNVSFFEDGVGPGTPAYQIFPAQSAGALNGWPSVVQWYMFHEGAWLFLDGGTLDLGTVRDSTLNAANKFQTFVEVFEQVAFIGIESLAVRSTICANGASAGTINPNDLCDGGS